MMHARAKKNNGFLPGLVTGGVVGAALAVALAPRLAAELRRRITDAADDTGDAASRRYRDVGARGVAQLAVTATTAADSRRS
jgi:gas vesicle protein